MGWIEEIDGLHEFFEAYFLGTEQSLERFESALDEKFTIVGPDGAENDRAATVRMVRDAHGHTDSLTISTSDHRLLAETDELLVATYIEHHQLRDGVNHRLATVVFRIDPEGSNGLRWLRVHETWLVD